MRVSATSQTAWTTGWTRRCAAVCFSQVCTNNHFEGWSNRLSSNIGHKHPTIWRLIESLQTDNNQNQNHLHPKFQVSVSVSLLWASKVFLIYCHSADFFLALQSGQHSWKAVICPREQVLGLETIFWPWPQILRPWPRPWPRPWY